MVEVTRKAYLASLVPVIVNAVLNEHQVIADIVAFVSQGDFPRSRLGEKQRGKVLASWVTRKLKTIAQFSIRDTEGPADPLAEAPQHRMSRSSKPPSTLGNSLRQSNMVPESDVAVPRSAAPVLEEYPQAPAGPVVAYEEQQPAVEEPTALPAIPVPSEAPPSVPQIAEPIPPRASSSRGSQQPGKVPPSPTTIEQPDLGFNFGDFAHRAGTPSQEAEPTSPTIETDFLPIRNKGRDSLPSQRRFSSIPGGGAELSLGERPSSRDVKSPPTLEEDIEDWPQEALMYQSAMGSDDGTDQGNVHRTSSQYSGFARRTRYDGSEYGY